MSTVLESNKELVRRVNDGLNDQDPELFTEHHAEDVVLHTVGEEIHGIEAALAHEQALWRAFPDLHHTTEDVLAEGEKVAYRFTASGTHEGPFQGIEPTGNSFEISGQGIVRVEDGELAEVWLNYDTLGMMQQLGVGGPPRG